MGKAKAHADGGGTKEAKAENSNAVQLQHVRIAQARRDFTTDGTDDTDGATAKCKMQNEEFLSVKSVKSAVKFLWLRLCRAGPLAPFCGQTAISQSCAIMQRAKEHPKKALAPRRRGAYIHRSF
jgi:hypothetical protein